MTHSNSLVLYRSGQSTLATTSSTASLISSRLFTQQAGTTIATELLYRILFDIINRLMGSFQRLAVKGIEEGSSFLERKMQERRERLSAAKSESEKDLNIVEEVGKLAESRGFICHMSAQKGELKMHARGPPGPPMWVRGVLEGIQEGRMQSRDFWIQTHEG